MVHIVKVEGPYIFRRKILRKTEYAKTVGYENVSVFEQWLYVDFSKFPRCFKFSREIVFPFQREISKKISTFHILREILASIFLKGDFWNLFSVRD